MDKVPFEQIKHYGAMLAIASHLLKRGLITTEEHRRLTAELQKNIIWRPVPRRANTPAPKKKNTQTIVLGKED